ncbi:MAG: hypothetical protein PHG49_01755 [Candidatus Pacebacteria bacterium]|nr:hypothetical protein [Candidatus Paceibacterota bacterium]
MYYYDDEPFPITPVVLVLVVVVFIFCYFVTGGLKSVTIIRDSTDTVVLDSENSESPYFKLGAVLTDSEVSLPETRIDNYFWLYESEGYILVDGDVWFFFVKEGRPNVVIELSEFPFESPP